MLRSSALPLRNAAFAWASAADPWPIANHASLAVTSVDARLYVQPVAPKPLFRTEIC